LARDARQLRTSFVGLSFYRSVDGEQVAAAKHVGEVLKYVPEGQEIAPRYSFYM
jgi:hypothetical protein